MDTTSADRVKHAMERRATFEEIARLEEELSATHPGALDDLYAHFINGYEELEEGADLVLAFHQANQFEVADGELYVEFPYDVCIWNATSHMWVRDVDGEPYFE